MQPQTPIRTNPPSNKPTVFSSEIGKTCESYYNKSSPNGLIDKQTGDMDMSLARKQYINPTLDRMLADADALLRTPGKVKRKEFSMESNRDHRLTVTLADHNDDLALLHALDALAEILLVRQYGVTQTDNKIIATPKK